MTELTSSRDNLAGESYDHRILEATLAFAKQVFNAAAASVFTYDADADELQFEAASGIGGLELVGARMSAHTGIAGMVIQTGAATIAGDLAANAQFNRDFAEQSGYVPNAICAAPLLYDDDLLGVIEVLDPEPERFSDLEIMFILEALADQVATSIYVLRELRTFRLASPELSSKRSRMASLVESLPDSVFEDGRSGILEAVLTELARNHA